MDLTPIFNAIATVGFPIVACVYMAYIYNRINNKLFEVVNANTEALTTVKEELHHIATVNPITDREITGE